MVKRELENVRRELRNLNTGQHENKRENTTGEIDNRREDCARANWTCHI